MNPARGRSWPLRGDPFRRGRSGAVCLAIGLLGAVLTGCPVAVTDSYDLAPEACADGVRAGDESDVDCGGSCAPCPLGRGCGSAGDCENGSCVREVCAPETCEDQELQADESGLDCGGPCPPCSSGERCRAHEDCVDRICEEGECARPTCTDLVRNGGESDVDCGGSCSGCPAEASCTSGSDCISGLCDEARRCASG